MLCTAESCKCFTAVDETITVTCLNILCFKKKKNILSEIFSVYLCCIVFAHVKKRNAKYLDTPAHCMRRILNVCHALNFRYCLWYFFRRSCFVFWQLIIRLKISKGHMHMFYIWVYIKLQLINPDIHTHNFTFQWAAQSHWDRSAKDKDWLTE